MRVRRQIVLFIFFAMISCIEGSDTILGYDYRLFQDTPIWDLAKAVKAENIDKIKKIATDDKNKIDYQEPKYGSTLLMLSIRNQNYNSCKTLLDLGADPNKHNSYNGTSAMIYAAGINIPQVDHVRFLKLLLAYKGNPNDEEIGPRQEGNSTRLTPLLAACTDPYKLSSTIEKVKLLVEAGADINHRNEFNATPLALAVIFDHYDIVMYLIDHGADYRRALSIVEGRERFLWDKLRLSLYPLDSENYRQKMVVVDFLKQNGIDYKSVPIPEYAIDFAKKRYPQSWKEYLEKY